MKSWALHFFHHSSPLNLEAVGEMNLGNYTTNWGDEGNNKAWKEKT